jgi:hypothetical protein
MSIMDIGCQCAFCKNKRVESLEEARGKWRDGTKEIIFKPYHYTCSDGCCDEYGVNVYVNDFTLTCDGDNTEEVVRCLMEFIGEDNVSIEYDYEDYN